jgi:NAD-dependent SIR2 family protein deacetylase
MTFLSKSHDESLELRCDSCAWTTTVGDLPEDAGYVQPDLCPDCAKAGELGFVRCESPADGTFPAGWTR